MAKFVSMTVHDALNALQWAESTGVWNAEYGRILAANPGRIIRPEQDYELMINCCKGRPDGIGEEDYDRGQRFLNWWGANYTENLTAMVVGDVLVACFQQYMNRYKHKTRSESKSLFTGEGWLRKDEKDGNQE